MQAQAYFNQEVLGLPPPLPARRLLGGVGGAAEAGGAAAASAAGAAAQRRRSRLEVPLHCCRRRQRWQRGRAGKDAALVTNLRDKGMATGRPPVQAFLRIFS